MASLLPGCGGQQLSPQVILDPLDAMDQCMPKSWTVMSVSILCM